MSLSIIEVIATLKSLKVSPDILVKAETELENLEAAKQEEKAEVGPKAKKQFVSILLDPEKKLAGLGDFTSLVFQIDETQDAGETLDRLYQATYDQRAAAKRKPRVITSVADAADGVKRKFLKERGLRVKTKEPIRTLVSDNTIPVA